MPDTPNPQDEIEGYRTIAVMVTDMALDSISGSIRFIESGKVLTDAERAELIRLYQVAMNRLVEIRQSLDLPNG